MKRLLTTTCLLVLISGSSIGEDRLQPVAAGITESLARELAEALGKLYPEDELMAGGGTVTSKSGARVHLGTVESLSGIVGVRELGKRLHGPESYVVTTTRDHDGRAAGLIVGGGERGLIYGVYGLLRKLGFGFTLNEDLPPAPRAGPFTLDGWELADRPLVPRRFVFNWHNFLSGCSSWNGDHWRQWILQSQKLGFNGIMLHAYGNNPMTGFPFQGIDKPVGNLSSTRLGRDWATMHVNDARRLVGGTVFDGPVMGSDAAVAGSDTDRTAAAQAMMAEAFAFAQERQVDVILAVDMDTSSANPQELITKLPKAARFSTSAGGDFWLPRPDVAEGHAYYKAQLGHLLEVYPQLDAFVLWFRKGGTPMTRLKPENLPGPWREEYEAIVANKPELANYWNRVGIFVLAKVAAAHRKALRELGREDVTIGVGSWGFDLQAAADYFLPEGVALYPLDYEVQWKESRLESPGGPEGVAKAAAHRPVYPIHWANHDDCTYVGPPYPPFEAFHDLLVRSKCDASGFGILHWTTRPLDLFFVGLNDAVWESSRNQSVEGTCRRMARALLGDRHEEALGAYLHAWLKGLPMIGRDTGNYFIDRELEGYDEALSSHRERMKLLDAIDAQALPPGRRAWIGYFRGLERFVLEIFENEALYRRALKLQKGGDLSGAREALAQTDVPGVIRRYTDTALLPGITRGEEGLVVSLNLRWLTHYRCLAQQLGTEPIRINYAPTIDEPLAQNRGRFTYFIDRRERMWEVRGEEETRIPATGNPAGWVEPEDEADDPIGNVAQSGLESEQPIQLRISPMMNHEHHALPAGHYKLTLVMGPVSADRNPAASCEIAIQLPGRREAVTRSVALRDVPVCAEFEIELEEDGVPSALVSPRGGLVRVSGLVLEPIGR